jgi:hypothetical protein
LKQANKKLHKRVVETTMVHFRMSALSLQILKVIVKTKMHRLNAKSAADIKCTNAK